MANIIHKLTGQIRQKCQAFARLVEQVKVILEPIYDQSLSQMYWFSRLSSKHVSKHLRRVASASALYSLGLTGISQTSTKRKSLLHVLLICRRFSYWNLNLKNGVQRDFICASIKILLIKISSLLTKILSRKDRWSEKPRVHAKTPHENILYRIPIPLYINLMVSTYIPFYAKNSNVKMKKKSFKKMLLLIVL